MADESDLCKTTWAYEVENFSFFSREGNYLESHKNRPTATPVNTKPTSHSDDNWNDFANGNDASKAAVQMMKRR